MEDQKQRVYDALNKMGIKYEVVEHEPVHTMEDMDRLGLPEKRNFMQELIPERFQRKETLPNHSR